MQLITKESGIQVLSEGQLKSIIESQDISQYLTNQAYYEGKNEKLLETTDSKTSTPNNSIPLPFARRTANDIVGYSGKPGLIKIIFDQDQNEDSLDYYEEIKDKSNLWLTTSEEYLDGIVKGQAAELAWVDENAIMRFSQVDREQCIFEYDGLISNELLFAIRYYKIRDFDIEGDVVYTWHAFVYWEDHIDQYKGDIPELNINNQYNPQAKQRTNDGINNAIGLVWEYVGSEPHSIGAVPLYPMPISSDNFGIVQPYLPIIDRLDSFGSDSISNSIDQFRDAVLLLSKKMDEDSAEKIALTRIIDNLGTDGDFAKYLTRETDVVNTIEAFKLFERLYYELVAVPNLSNEKFGTQSGIAIMYALIPFENLVSQIETYFSRGIEYRMDLINKALVYLNKKPLEYEIKWERNLPLDLANRADIVVKLKESGLLSDETLLKMFPENIVADVTAEIEKRDNEKLERAAKGLMQMAAFTTEPLDDTEDDE